MPKRWMTPSVLMGALLLIGGVWWIGVAASLTAHRPIALPAQDPTQASDFTTRIIARTNLYRVAHGCQPLAPNTILMATAQAHSADMAASDFVGHNSSSGVTVGDRLKAAGYAYSTFAENIAWGPKTPEQVVDMWFNESPPNDEHRKNILNCALHDVGVGYIFLANDPGKVTAYTYWTEDFGARKTP